MATGKQADTHVHTHVFLQSSSASVGLAPINTLCQSTSCASFYFQRIHTKHECHLVAVYLSMNPFKIQKPAKCINDKEALQMLFIGCMYTAVFLSHKTTSSFKRMHSQYTLMLFEGQRCC